MALPKKRYYIVSAEFDPPLTKEEARKMMKDEISIHTWAFTRDGGPVEPVQKFKILSIGTIAHLP